MTQQKILIADSNPSDAELTVFHLTSELYETKVFSDGPSVLTGFVSYAPDLILLETILPGIDGFAVCREIRQRSNIPIIMLSSKI